MALRRYGCGRLAQDARRGAAGAGAEHELLWRGPAGEEEEGHEPDAEEEKGDAARAEMQRRAKGGRSDVEAEAAGVAGEQPGVRRGVEDPEDLVGDASACGRVVG